MKLSQEIDRTASSESPSVPGSLALGMPAQMEVRSFRWGAEIKIRDGVIVEGHPGVETKLLMPFAHGNPPQASNDGEARAVSCHGCPYLGVTKYGEANCAHPINLEYYKCPQHMGSLHNALLPHYACTARELATPRQMRIFRIKHKWSYIFWEYYEGTGINPYREGFGLPRSRRPENAEVRRTGENSDQSHDPNPHGY